MLEARDISFAYGRAAPVLSGVSLGVGRGEIVGLSGPSGCGKSTLARLLAGYLTSRSGAVLVDGAAPAKGWSPVQYVHQAAYLSVDPRWRIGAILDEAGPVDEALRNQLGVSRRWFERYPHEISGGELQRVVLLRALGPRTRYLVADEVSAMLDPITQVEVWQALQARAGAGLGILAISHGDALLERVATRRLHLEAGRLLPVSGSATKAIGNAGSPQCGKWPLEPANLPA
ncbi:peptide/nickel transport system ATP-binding protein [Devosia enhydra]|uniref:Peptide/nickel transport system ATP-binding protein n=1 Tax=Devosia enhydra TaxID=665118 RepID=A0A1K2I3E3_9HYPH|nr:ATP-binding cassette domain-containing protein [Devosia enhydra]SFZ86276.1 peptide/nickel transport system ATP-binding protein [Devosia enhydra]